MIHGERLVDDTPHIRVSLADVELPNHVRFTQYVFLMRRCAMTAVLDDLGDRVLLMRRHRFIVDCWVWELPGGYVDDGEDSLSRPGTFPVPSLITLVTAVMRACDTESAAFSLRSDMASTPVIEPDGRPLPRITVAARPAPIPPS